MIIWHNGEFKDDRAPVLSVHDRIRLGEGVFNTMLLADGKIHHARGHIEKLLGNARFLLGEWDAPPWESLFDAAQELVRRNGFNTGRYAFNMMITGGPGGPSGAGLKPPEKRDVQILMRALPTQLPHGPVHAIIAQSVRRNEGSPLSNFKCTYYGENILAAREAAGKGANEAIMLNNKGHVACATSASVLMVQDGKFHTPRLSDGCQNSTTRAIAIKKHGAIERSITPQELAASEGIYLTNSLRGAVPLIKLEGIDLPMPALTLDPDFHLE